MKIQYYQELVRRHSRVALVGEKGIGKSYILNRICNKVIDFSKLVMVPEHFAAGLVSSIGVRDPEIENELLKRRIDQKKIITLAWNHIDNIGIDNFELIENLNNFPAVKDVLSFISLKKDTVITTCDRDFAKRAGCRVEEVLRMDVDTQIFEVTGGIAFYVQCMRRAMKKMSFKKALEQEMGEFGSMRLFAMLKFEEMLSHARGSSMLIAVMKTLCWGPLRVSEIAERNYRIAGVMNSILKRMEAADMIKKEGRLYSIKDPVIGRCLQ